MRVNRDEGSLTQEIDSEKHRGMGMVGMGVGGWGSLLKGI